MHQRVELAGVHPSGVIFRNHGCFCSFLDGARAYAVSGMPSSPSRMETFHPLGVAAVYRSSIKYPPIQVVCARVVSKSRPVTKSKRESRLEYDVLGAEARA